MPAPAHGRGDDSVTQRAFAGGEHLLRSDREQTTAPLLDAGFQVAAKTTCLMIDDLMARTDREPHSRKAARGKGNYGGSADGSGQVHRPGVRAEKELGARKHGGGFARGESAAKIDLRATPGCGCGCGCGMVFSCSDERKSMGRMACAQLVKQGAPVVCTPVLGLHLGARAADEKRCAAQRSKRVGGSLVFGVREAQIPVAEVVGSSVTKRMQEIGKTVGFRLKASGRRVDAARGF